MSDQANDKRAFERWVTIEHQYVRGVAAALLLIAIISLFTGMLRNPDADPVIAALNTMMTLVLAGAAIWGLWWSFSRARIEQSLQRTMQDGGSNAIALAVIQAVVGVLFLLDGSLAPMLIGALMLANAAFFGWRSRQITQLRG